MMNAKKNSRDFFAILAISAGPCYNVSNYGEEEKEYARQASPGGCEPGRRGRRFGAAV